MDPETERHMAALLLEEAARLKRDAEISGVSAYLAKPLVRSRPSSTFLTATVRSVQQANRMAEINEMWARRNLELENQKRKMRHVSRGHHYRDMDDAARSRGRHDRVHSRDRGQREKRGRTSMDSGEEEDENRKRSRTRDASAERSLRSSEERQRWHSDADGQGRHRRKTREEEDRLEDTERESKKQRHRSNGMTSVLTDRGQVSHGAYQSTWDSHGDRRGHVARASDTEVAGRAADVATESGKRKRSYHEESDEEREDREHSINAGQSAEEGLDDEGIQQFLQSRAKRGRGAIGSRIDEPGPYLPPPEREDLEEGPPNVIARERLVSPASCERPAGPENRGGDDVERVGEVPKVSKKKKRKRSGGTSGESGEERKDRRKKKKREKKGRGGSRSTVSEEDGATFKKAKRRRERESSGSSEEDSERERSEERRRRKRHRKRSESSEEEGEFSNKVKRVKHRK